MISFKKNIRNLDNRSTTRTSTKTNKVVIPQIDVNGDKLNDAINIQRYSLTGTGHSLKIRSAYQKNTPFCGLVENVATGNTKTRVFPPNLMRIASVDNVADLDDTVRAEEKNGKVPDPTWNMKNDDGEIIKENVFNEETEKWEKRVYNVPLYKQYTNGKGEAYTELTNARLEDEGGLYIHSDNKYNYISNYNILFFNGFEVTDSGAKVPESEGVYFALDSLGGDASVGVNAFKSAGKVTIKQYLKTVFMHPEYGVVRYKDLKGGSIERGLRKGRFDFDGGHGVTAQVLNGEGKEVAILDDRNSFRLSDYIPINSNKTDEVTSAKEAAEIIKKEAKEDASGNVKETVTDDTEGDDFI